MEECDQAAGVEESSSTEDKGYGGWEYILAEVKDCLPGIDSDSESSTLPEETDGVFQRKIATFDNTDSDSDISSLTNFPKAGSERHDTSTLNSEGYASASSSSPTSNTSSATSKSTTMNPGLSSSSSVNQEHSSMLLFQRLHNHLNTRDGDNLCGITDDKDDLHLTDMDLDLPLYENDKLTFYTENDEDHSPPPMDMRRGQYQPIMDSEASSGILSRDESNDDYLESNDSEGKAPVLSLKGLEGFDLDDLLDDSYGEDNIDVSLTSLNLDKDQTSQYDLMNQLVDLSKTQKGKEDGTVSNSEAGDSKQHFLASRQFQNEPGGQENNIEEEVLEKADIEDNKEKKIEDLSSNPISSSSGSFSSTAELSLSEPTTIYLDLRPKADSDTNNEKQEESQETQNVEKPVNRVMRRRVRAQTKSIGVSASNNIDQDQVMKRVQSLSRIRTMTREESEDSDSENDDDDFKAWQAERNRIKERSSLSAAVSPKNKAKKMDTETITHHKGNSSLSFTSSTSNKRSTKYDRNLQSNSGANDNSKPARNTAFGENIPGIEHIDNSIYDGDRRILNDDVTCLDLDELSESFDVDENNAGIYARQRLKKEKQEKGNVTTTSSLRNKADKTNNKNKGKVTVSFAEEPKKDDNDTTNIYRAKNLNSTAWKPSNEDNSSNVVKKTTDSITSSVQTEDSFPLTRNSDLAFHKVVEDMLQRRGDVKLIDKTVTDKHIEAQSVLAKKQYELAKSIGLSSSSYLDDRQVLRETKLKLKVLLEKEEQKLGNATRVLYDMDASYETEVPNIPPELNTEKSQMVLLTVNMSSTGCIVTHRTSGGHKATSVDPNIGFSITYPMLISWFLALVPEDLTKLHQARMDDTFTIDIDPELVPEISNGKDAPTIPISVDVPFNVVALHQSWQEDTQSLSLQAIVIPNFYYKPESKRGRKKAKKEDAFLQVVWHFLQSNRIQDVCPWHDKPESPIHYSLSEIIITCATKPLSTYVSASNDPVLIKKALKNKPGMFCKVMTPEDQVPCNPPSTTFGKLQTTMCLLQKEAFMFPTAVMDVMIRVQTSCFDLTGLKLAYVTREFINDNTLYHSNSMKSNPKEVVPCVVIAIRGRSVIARWSKIVGPRDPVLARMSERMSLNATYGEQLSIKRGDESLPTDVNMFCYPRSETRAMHQLCIWFGGRVDVECQPYKKLLQPNVPISNGLTTKSDKPNVNGKSNGKNQKNKSRSNSTTSINNENESNASSSITDLLQSSSFVVNCCNTRIFLVVSPRLPTQFISDVLHVVTQQGFQLQGIRRFRLNERKAAALSISQRYFPCFCPRLDSDTPVDVDYFEDIWWIRPATVFLLSRENAAAHSSGLFHALQTDLMVNLSPPDEEGHVKVITYQCFHLTPYTDAVEHAIGSMTKVPEVELSTGASPRSFYSNPEMEQVTVLSLLGEKAIDGAGEVLRSLVHGEFSYADEERNSAHTDEESEMEAFRGFELIALKWLPSLNGMQANELTPYEVGTPAWHESIPILQSSPVMLCVLRRVNAFEVLEDAMRIPRYSCSMSDVVFNAEKFTHVMSITPEIAYRQMKVFFSDKELFPDNQSRPLLKYLPPPTRVHQYRQQQNVKPVNGYADTNGSGDQLNNSFSNGNSRNSDNSKRSSGKKKKKQNGKKDNNNNNNNQNSNGGSNTSFSLPEESIFSSMVSCQQPLTSVLVIKPDAFPRHFIKIFRQLHYEGFKVVAAKVVKLTEDEALQILPNFLKDMQGEVQVYLDHMTSGLSLVACVQRDNAVRHLCQLAGPHDPRIARSRCYLQRQNGSSTTRATWRALFGIDNMSNGIHVSDSYLSACGELKVFFPEGLCCQETLELKMELVPTPAEDKFMCLDKMKGREVKILPDDRQTNHSTSLRVTYMPRKPVVVILTPPLFHTNGTSRPRQSRHPLTRRPMGLAHGTIPPFVEILDQLLTQGFEICALRQVWFRQSQAAEILNILNYTQNVDSMITSSVQGPSLLLILQRENALVLFDSILGSTKSNNDSLYHKYSSNILRSQKEEQTISAAKYLFPRVPFNNSVLSISHKRALEWKDRNGDTPDANMDK
ncbi:dynein axonemal assembly factor 8-like [Styela clava]